jgi:hypothetical protein
MIHTLSKFYMSNRRRTLLYGALATLLLLQVIAAAAQTATPVPSLDIPTDVIFDEANTWIVTFAPIAAIGIGITIALAVLGYIGKMIAQAFH